MAPGPYRRPKAALQLTGIKELDRKLKSLVDREAKNIVRNANRAALRIGAAALKEELPVGKRKKLKKSVGSSLKRDPKVGMTVGKFGTNVGKKGKQIAIAAPVLSGTKERQTKSTGTKPRAASVKHRAAKKRLSSRFKKSRSRFEKSRSSLMRKRNTPQLASQNTALARRPQPAPAPQQQTGAGRRTGAIRQGNNALKRAYERSRGAMISKMAEVVRSGLAKLMRGK